MLEAIRLNQWMENEFKGYKARFNNSGDKCIVTITYLDSIPIDAESSKNISDKSDAIKFLTGEYNQEKNFDPAISIKRYK